MPAALHDAAATVIFAIRGVAVRCQQAIAHAPDSSIEVKQVFAQKLLADSQALLGQAVVAPVAAGVSVWLVAEANQLIRDTLSPI